MPTILYRPEVMEACIAELEGVIADFTTLDSSLSELGSMIPTISSGEVADVVKGYHGQLNGQAKALKKLITRTTELLENANIYFVAKDESLAKRLQGSVG